MVYYSPSRERIFPRPGRFCALLIDSDPVVCENWSAAVSGFEGDIESEVVSDLGEGRKRAAHRFFDVVFFSEIPRENEDWEWIRSPRSPWESGSFLIFLPHRDMTECAGDLTSFHSIYESSGALSSRKNSPCIFEHYWSAIGCRKPCRRP